MNFYRKVPRKITCFSMGLYELAQKIQILKLNLYKYNIEIIVMS